MAKQKAQERRHAILRELLETLLPAIPFGLGAGYATGNYVISVATGLAISIAIGVLARLDQAFLRPRLKDLSRDWQVGLEIITSLLEHIGGAVLALLVCSRIFGFAVQATTTWIIVGTIFVGFLAIHSAGYALRFYRQLKEKERLEEQLRALATQAELKALKAQINPHFLFNTLNTIAALAHTDPEQAEATVERLAGMFRYVLAGSERGLVPLEEELSFVDNYLEIERARFGERLHVTYEPGDGIARQVLDVPVPALILQPLVENAVQHGQGSDGRIDLIIRVRAHDDEIEIAIADQGPGMPRAGAGGLWSAGSARGGVGASAGVGAGQGIGLRNIDERLQKTYGPEYRLEIRDNKPHGTIVTLKIPAGGRGWQPGGLAVVE